LGGESRFVAVLFADIRGFTRFSESRNPGDVVTTLNRVLSEITGPVLRHNGILDKYIGDGLLAFFEPFVGPADAVRSAAATTREMQRAFANLQREAAGAGLGELGLGIGINAGPVIVGNIGSEEVMDCTVIGDTVNVAARLQTEAESGQILVTAAVYEVGRGGLHVEVAAPLLLRGRREPVDVYRLRWDT
jgi:adenylate cyclase